MDDQLFYRDIGNGSPTLLLHGFAEDGTVWDHQAAALCGTTAPAGGAALGPDATSNATCRLILPDLPGVGRSASSITPDSIEAMATTIRDLLDHLEIQQCTLIGHSMGGYIALAFAELYPERLNAFGLFHSTAYPDSEEKKATRRKAIEFMRTNGSAPFIRQSTPNLFSAHTRENRPELIEATIAKYSGLAPEALIACYEAMITRPDRTAVLRNFAGPVFFLMGEDDTVIPLQQALQQCYLPAISHLHIIKNAGHMAMLEAPDQSTQHLNNFITFVSSI